MDSSEIYSQVREHYSAAAKSTNAKYGEAIARSFGYSEEELRGASEDANLGLSCGNPLGLANLQPGETIIDLGSGAGFDAFLAAPRVGPSGNVIGVDMNEDMLIRANKIKADRRVENVAFIKSSITAIELDSAIADCIISNCVVNLVPEAEKHLVFKEIFRLLKPGGRVAISDILAKRPLTKKLKEDVAMYVGCIAGASQLVDYETYLADAGFSDVVIVDSHADLNVYLQANVEGAGESQCCMPSSTDKRTGPLPALSYDGDLNLWAGSYKIYAIKA